MHGWTGCPWPAGRFVYLHCSFLILLHPEPRCREPLFSFVNLLLFFWLFQSWVRARGCWRKRNCLSVELGAGHPMACGLEAWLSASLTWPCQFLSCFLGISCFVLADCRGAFSICFKLVVTSQAVDNLKIPSTVACGLLAPLPITMYYMLVTHVAIW